MTEPLHLDWDTLGPAVVETVRTPLLVPVEAVRTLGYFWFRLVELPDPGIGD